MENLSIVGPKILEQLKSSDYKNSVYAFAEIIDNCIDAKANEIEILTITKDGAVTDIYFIDNGEGMDKTILQKCVIFSVSNNTKGSKKTGVFGMGLPNSSLSQCSKFSVLSKIGEEWWENTVDIKKMIAIGTLNIDPIAIAANETIKGVLDRTKIEMPKTIIHWSDLDTIDSLRAITLNDRAERLIGRIHRYKIRNGLTIRFLNYSDDNKKADINHVFVENDPLFLTTGNSWIAPIINDLALDHSDTDPKFSLSTYFTKFIFPNDKKRVKPLFYLPDEAQETIELKWHRKTYKINLTLAIAYQDVQKPGRRAGGVTKFGQQLGIKVKGSGNYPSGNISWVRNQREITCGNHSLFNVTQENQRFWSIELSYNTDDTKDNVLDKLLGLSNSKQSIKYTPETLSPDDTSETASENDKKEELISKITIALNHAISRASTILSQQAREWKRVEDSIRGTGGTGGAGIPGPTNTTYTVLLDALGKGANITEIEIKKLVAKLKKYLPTIPESQIEEAVRKYNAIGLQNIIIYCEIDERDLFQTDKFQGINITLINIKHQFYIKIIEPLKEKNQNDLLASIELLISSMSRTGENNFVDQSKEIIKEFQELTSKDIKIMLTKQSQITLSDEDDGDETEEEALVNL